MGGIPYIKTKIGEHDYGKDAGCCGHASCKYFKEFCPLYNVQRIEEAKVVTWQMAANARLYGNGVPEQPLSRGGAEMNSIYDHPELAGMSKDERAQLGREIEVGRYTCWGDGSGYEYDLMSRNVIGPGGPLEQVYDIYSYGINHQALTYSEWNAWVDKFQYDYRYGRVSDTNAECVLFPNVDNPWMMTEYVYRGVGGENSSGKIATDMPSEYVVEPPVYDPDTLKLVNGDGWMKVSQGSDESKIWNDKYKSLYSNEVESHEFERNGEEVAESAANVRRFRFVETWSSLIDFTTGEIDSVNSSRDEENQLSVSDFSNGKAGNLSTRDAGIRLYPARLPVQSVKWGEHGNIPPHTLDMMAPADWMDPTASVAKVRARYVAHVGAPLYASRDGVITWNDRYAFIEDFTETGVSYDSAGRKIYQYSVSGNGDAVPMPYKMEYGTQRVLKPFEKVMGVAGTDNVCHGGCALCSGSGNPNGVLTCRHLSSLSNSDTEGINAGNAYFIREQCMDAGDGGHGCPNYVASRRHPLIATYQNDIISRNQLSSNLRNTTAASMMVATMGVGGALMGAGMMATGIAAEVDMLYQQYKNLSKYKDADVTYELKYEIVHAQPSPAQLNKKKYNEFGNGVQIVPGTGKYAMDSEKDANPFSGGDTNAYSDISTLSFGRFFRNVMPCAKQAHCHAFAEIDQADGWTAGKKAGGDGECRYYCSRGGMGCPYNCAPKRAVEFANTASLIPGIVSEIVALYETMTRYGCWELTAGHVFKETAKRYRKWKADKDDDDSPLWLIIDETWAIWQKESDISVVATKISDKAVTSTVGSSENFAGAALIAANEQLPVGYAKVFEFRTEKSTKEVLNKPWYKSDSDGNYEKIMISVYKVIDSFYWYQPLYNDGGTVSRNDGENASPRMLQHVDKDGCWLCKVEYGVGVPESNCLIVDNGERFIGGWHPEYKDYSKIGTEFMQDIISDASREGQAMGDYVRNGDYDPMPQTVNKKGYWIDQSGEYIMDERSTGLDFPIAGNDDRESNGGSVPCISFHKTNSTMDGESGKKRQPKVDHGAVFSNDPKQMVVEEYKGKRPEFQDPNNNFKYVASCIVNDSDLLPTMRHALHCPKCDYYIHIRYLTLEDSKCPWCGSYFEVIHGDTGAGFGSGGDSSSSEGGGGDEPEPFAAEGKTWAEALPEASVMKKFFKLYAMGIAEVWAPAGTSIPTDAYFWRHQAFITNATKRQIYHRIGTKGQSGLGKTEVDEDGNRKDTDVEGNPKVGYLFDQMTRIGELTMGYPEGFGAFTPVPRNGVKGERYDNALVDWNGDPADIVGMYNPVMPRHMIPALYPEYDDGLEDEGVIAPYTPSPNDALKIVSLDQIRVLRNAIEPTYAYVSEEPWNGEYPTFRASYDQREMQDQPIIFQGKRAMIKPIVLAMTDDNRDSFQSYYSGDIVYGNVREYFPSGYTWWYMQQVLGGRVTMHEGGRYHMDDTKETNESAGHVFGGSGGEYTCGDRTIAKCAISIYGMLPLDKEIVQAYVIVEPSGVDPSKNPVGRSWTGGPVMYYHYHAKTAKHMYGNRVYDKNFKGDDGFEQHLHGTAGYPNEEYFDENGNHVSPHGPNWFAPLYQDESAYRMWGAQSHSIDDDRFCYYEETFSRTMVNLPGLFDTSFYKNMGTPKEMVMDESDENEIGFGYSGSSFPENDGFTRYNFKTDRKRDSRYQYLVVDADGNLVLKYPEAEVWKTKTAEEIQEVIDLNTCEVEFSASDGTEEGTVSYTFTETDAEVYHDEMPDQSQAISGYFDMGWTNTRGYVTGKYRIDAGNGASSWSTPVIFQDDLKVTDGAGGYVGGGDNNDNEGKTARVLDVTPVVKKMYNDRINRSFGVDAGKSIEELSNWSFYSPVAEDIDAIDEDIADQNKYSELGEAVWKFNRSIVLTETCAYPKTDGGGDPPEISTEGDKYELAEKLTSLVVSFTMPMVITAENDRYGEEDDQRLASGTYEKIEDVLDLMKVVFPGSTFETLGTGRIRVKSEKDIEIPEIAGSSFYTLIGLMPGAVYRAIRDRTVQCSSSISGHEPAMLLKTPVDDDDEEEDDVGSSDNSWRYNVDNDATQSFTFDLIRAPLLVKERGWRYTSGDSENPPDGINTYFYDKPFSENCLISRIVFKPSSSSEYQCDSYRVMLKRSGDDSWFKIFGCHRANGSYAPDVEGEGSWDGSSFTIDVNEIHNCRYVKVECESKPTFVEHKFVISYYEKAGDNGDTLHSSHGYQAIVEGSVGEFDEFTNVSLSGLKAHVGVENDGDDDEPEEETVTIIASQVIGDSHDRMRLFFDREMNAPGDDASQYIRFNVRRYCGGVDGLVVYGLPYKTEKGDSTFGNSGGVDMYLTMTDGYDTFEMPLNGYNSMIELPFTPCEIARVSLSGGVGVSLTEIDSEDAVLWTTESLSVNVPGDDGEFIEKTIKVIRSGTYFYDPVRRMIILPRTDQDGTSWTAFEDEVSGYETFRTYLPSSVVVWYTDGSGKSIELPAVANGEGPSFMLEKGAINTIVSSECNLTNTGRMSCKILDPNGKKEKKEEDESNEGDEDEEDTGYGRRIKSIPFVCSNHTPSTLTIESASRSNSKQGTVKFNAGEFRLPAFTGKELVFKDDDDQIFIDLFGECACNCRGKCYTDMTFTGPANYVISGHITVEAPKKTTRTIQFGDSVIQYEELTGGIRQGFLVVRCTPSSIQSGRMTKCYSLPKLLIYAKDMNPYTEVNPSAAPPPPGE